ncbi:hypothetical protein AGDE_13102 [Angomonas deanei]|uniref:Uncharacterized protein n=1 Tax=Angomonas deanei TaxID=59799 RepID=A0A7G2CF56_9TRYP|nr:hypothetical protein AGDE_13102 [Angomonas deanei]CAD2218538.1 hypothetical protein, conserved [Angomonas deanei]|eukprot:EPY22726.1 hypothetical protein AGDE_13102 [Angomonas deanei]
MPPKGNSKRGGAAAGRRKEPAVLPVAQKRPRETTTTSSVTANPHREVLALQNANPILSFWWRCANTRSFLPLALYALDVDWQGIYRLRDGHVAPKSKEDGDKKGQATVHEQVMVAYRLVTDQRLHTAYDCLLLARRLLCDKENFVAKTADGGKSKKTRARATRRIVLR